MGEKVVMRVLTRKKLDRLEDLGGAGKNYKIVKDSNCRALMADMITGPTGSGKSTTLYSILKIMNKEGWTLSRWKIRWNIAIEGVNQSRWSGNRLWFASGLRSILRQIRTFVMVGDIGPPQIQKLWHSLAEVPKGYNYYKRESRDSKTYQPKILTTELPKRLGVVVRKTNNPSLWFCSTLNDVLDKTCYCIDKNLS